MTTTRAAALYFALVFSAGFVLGTVRALLLVPRVGERDAELLETPVMLAVVVLAARFVVRRTPPSTRARRLWIGVPALALLLLAEVAVVLVVRAQPLGQYVAGRDPLAGVVYLVALAVFGVAPAVVDPPRVTRVL